MMLIKASVEVKSRFNDIYLVKRLGDLHPAKYMVVVEPYSIGWDAEERVCLMEYTDCYRYHTWRDAFLKYREKVHENLDEIYKNLTGGGVSG